MKKHFCLNIILAFCLLASACNKKDTTASSKLAEEEQKKELNKVDPPPSKKPAAKYDIKNFQKSYNNCTAGSDSCTYIRISYQLLTDSPQSTKINKSIIDTITKYSFTYEKPYNSIDESMNAYIKEYESYRKDMASTGNSEYMMNWYYDEKGAVEYDNGSILSYSMTNESFTGGAHGSNYVNYYIFDQTSGNVLTYKDIFIKGSDKDLNKLIDKKFRQSKGLKPGESLVDGGGLFENHIEHNDNFAVFKDGIKFYYNSYEIAPYSSGPTELIFSWAELGDLVNKNLKLNN